MTARRTLLTFLHGLLCLILATTARGPLRAQVPSDRGLPMIVLSGPASGARLPVAPMIFEAVALDPAGGPITVVEFLADGEVVARSDRSGDLFPTVIGLKVAHRAVWDQPVPGIRVLTARGLRGATTVAKSEPIRVLVGDPAPPIQPPVIPIIPPNPPPGAGVSVTVSALDPLAVEADPNDLMTVEFRRTGDLSQPLRVYFKAGGSADWASDLMVVAGGLKPEPVDAPSLAPWIRSVVIPAGSAVAKLALAPVTDDKAEGDEILYLAIIPRPDGVTPGAEPSDYLPGLPGDTRVSIRDSTKPAPANAPEVRIVGDQTATSEPSQRIRVRPGRLVFQRVGEPVEPLRIRYAVGGSASNGGDFDLLDGDLTLGAGEMQAELLVIGRADDLVEPEETVVVKLLEDPSYRIDPSAAWAQVTLADTTEPAGAMLKPLAPTPGQALRVGSETALTWVAVDPKGYLPRVSFWANGQPIGESRLEFFRAPDPGSPIEHTLIWKVAVEGRIRIDAAAYDAQGLKAASTSMMVVGLPPVEPGTGPSHPADRSPTDRRISDDEWMGYSKHWRHGVPWGGTEVAGTLPSGTVPIGHLTRAGYLWRAGGTYQFDPSMGFPMGWIPTGAELPGTADRLEGLRRALSDPAPAPTLGTNGTPERLPDSYLLLESRPVDGQKIDLSIHVGAAANTRCQAIEIHLGPGASVSIGSDEAQWDAKSGILRWGPFLDDTLRSLKAVVTVPDPASIAGVGSFDGRDRRADFMVSKASAPGAPISIPRLTALEATPHGDAKLMLIGGQPGTVMDLEVSEDMTTWRRIGRMAMNGQPLLQLDTDAASSTRRFYRVVPRGP